MRERESERARKRENDLALDLPLETDALRTEAIVH